MDEKDAFLKASRPDYPYLSVTQATPPRPYFRKRKWTDWSTASSSEGGKIRPEIRHQLMHDRLRIAQQHHKLKELLASLKAVIIRIYPENEWGLMLFRLIPVFCCHTYLSTQNKATSWACGRQAHWNSWFCEEHALVYNLHTHPSKREVEVPFVEECYEDMEDESIEEGEKEDMRAWQLQRQPLLSFPSGHPLGDYIVR